MKCTACGHEIVTDEGYFTAIIKNERMDFHIPHRPTFFYKEKRDVQYLPPLQTADNSEPRGGQISSY